MAFLFEIIAFDIGSCRLIEKAGGGRIELCANPLEGGTTVSYGMMKAARKAVSIPIFPIIRPRGGDFLYTDEEYAIIQQDILLCRETGMDGVVFGMLDKDGNVDIPKISRLVELAYPMEVTFHRAFDHSREPLKALEDIIQCGCNRILTSGAADTAIEGIELIKACVAAADGRITILPGSGIRSGNIKALAAATGLTEFHSSARKKVASAMSYRNGNIHEEGGTYGVDPEEVEALVREVSGER
ncbi:copper homeostasis protein CutC [Flavihumibacter profundi]|uniref:copper homeostasis protein CutC n=1 Tax=Flavihumibacter profundi TaxID=2716883 RepID=UPI001CC463B4|nr:copper homeostasis protein CutC [Flavihumibacter profundi]MBZ5856382.1 copper homeostasis protein CutC [Flavihumibacter profundi]